MKNSYEFSKELKISKTKYLMFPVKSSVFFPISVMTVPFLEFVSPKMWCIS